MRVSRRTIILVLAAVAALLVVAVAIHGNGSLAAWHSRLRAAGSRMSDRDCDHPRRPHASIDLADASALGRDRRVARRRHRREHRHLFVDPDEAVEAARRRRRLGGLSLGGIAHRDGRAPRGVVARVPTTSGRGCTRFATCSRFAACRSTSGRRGRSSGRTACWSPTTISPRLASSRRSGASPRPRTIPRSSSRTGSGGPASAPTRACSARPCASTGAALRSPAVAPREFQGTTVGLNFEVWLPAALAPELLNGSRELVDRSIRGYFRDGKAPGGRHARAGAGRSGRRHAGSWRAPIRRRTPRSRARCCRSWGRRAVRCG